MSIERARFSSKVFREVIKEERTVEFVTGVGVCVGVSGDGCFGVMVEERAVAVAVAVAGVNWWANRLGVVKN